MDLWNIRDLKIPPINRTKCELKDIDAKLLRSALQEGIDYFENQELLATEAAVLSRTIYRMKMKFRSSKDFKAIEKLNRALRNYLQIRIHNILKRVYELLPQSWEIENDYFPRKNLIDYILVRLQGLGMLLSRILDTCKVASYLYRKRMNLGHFWNIAAVVFAAIARIFVICRAMIRFTCVLYGNILPFSTKIPASASKWLPDDYQLPESLNEWLNIDWLDLDATVIEIPDQECKIMSYFNLIDDSDDDDVQIFDEYVVINDNDEEPCVVVKDESDESVAICDELKGFQDNDVDIGEVVQLDDDDDQVIDLSESIGHNNHSKTKNKKKQKKFRGRVDKNIKRKNNHFFKDSKKNVTGEKFKKKRNKNRYFNTKM